MEVPAVAYPFGFQNRRVRLQANAAGYKYACEVSNRVATQKDSRMAVPRLEVDRNMNAPDVVRRMSGTRKPTGDLVANVKAEIRRLKRRLSPQ